MGTARLLLRAPASSDASAACRSLRLLLSPAESHGVVGARVASRAIAVRCRRKEKGEKRGPPRCTHGDRRQGQACPLQTPIQLLSPPIASAPCHGLRRPCLPRPAPVPRRPCGRRVCGRAGLQRRAFQGAPRRDTSSDGRLQLLEQARRPGAHLLTPPAGRLNSMHPRYGPFHPLAPSDPMWG